MIQLPGAPVTPTVLAKRRDQAHMAAVNDATPTPDLVRRRWLAIVLARVAGSAGSVFGLVLLGRAQTLGPKLLGIAILLSGLFVVATVPRALAHRWRTPDA